MKIRSKLLISFVVVTLLMAIVGTVTYVENRNTKESATDELYGVISNLDCAWALIECLQNQEIAAKDYVFLGKAEGKTEYFAEKERAHEYYKTYFSGAGKEVGSLLEKYDSNIEKYHSLMEEAFALYEQGADLETVKNKVNEADACMGIAQEEALNSIIQYVHMEQLKPAKEQIENDIDNTTYTIIGSSILAVLLAMMAGFFISRTIVDPILKLKKATVELGKGNLDTRISIDSKDEIGDLADSFNQMVQDLKETTASRDELEKEVGQRKRAQEALQREKTNMYNILENNSDGIVIVDSEGVVRFANPAARSLFGTTEEEFLGEIFGFPAAAGKTTEIDIVREGGKTGVAEMRVVETYWEGEVARLASIRDITEHKRML